MKKIIGIVAVFLLCVSNVYAARPLSTDDAGVVEKGVFEMELGAEYVKASDPETNLSLAVTTGILENVCFGIEVPYQFLNVADGDDINGLDDFALSSKWNFMSGHELLPDAAIKIAYKTESANNDRGIGTGRPEYSVTGILSKAFGHVTYHLNLGCAIKQEAEDAFTYNFAGEYEFNDRTRIVGEVFGDTILSGKFNDSATSVLVGLNYDVADNVTWDFGWTLGVSEAEPDFKVTTGITIPFGGK